MHTPPQFGFLKRWPECFALLSLLLFVITVTKIPHGDVLGSLARAQAVDISGGWVSFLDFWEHRPLYYSFVIQILYYLSAGNSLEYFPLVSATVVILSALSFSSCFNRDKRYLVFALTLISIGSVSFWVLWQPAFFSVIFALLSTSFILSKARLYNLIGYILLALVFLMKLTTGTIVLIHLLGLWLLFPEQKKQLLMAFIGFSLVGLLLFAISLLIHNEFQSLIVSTVAQGNKSFTLMDRLTRSWQAIMGAVIHIPVLTPCLALIIFSLISNISRITKLVFLTMLMLVLLTSFIQGSKFSYQLAAMSLIFIYSCLIYYRKNSEKYFLFSSAAIISLSVVSVLTYFYIDSFQNIQSGQFRLFYTSPFVPLALIIFVTTCLLFVHKPTAMLILLLLFFIDPSSRAFHINKERETYEIIKQFSNFKTIHDIPIDEKVLYLTPSTGAFFMRQPPACEMIYPVPLQRFRITKIRRELKKIPFVQELNNCVKSYNGKWILHSPDWFNTAVIKTTETQTLLDKYNIEKTIGNISILKLSEPQLTKSQ